MASERLTTRDLNEVLKKLENAYFDNSDWIRLGLKLGLHMRTLNVIHSNNPRDANRCLVECLTKWLEGADDVIKIYGMPTYSVLADALDAIYKKDSAAYIRGSLDQTTEGKSVKGQGDTGSKRPKTTKEAGGIEETDCGTGTILPSQATPSSDVDTRTIEKWLQEGTVDLTVTRINMHGASGSGKTCTQLLLLNEPPPLVSVTDSTPIACPTVQATRISIDNDNQKMKWKRVTTADLVKQLASDLKAPKVVSQTSVEEAPKETKTHEQNERVDKPLHQSKDKKQKESTDATKKVIEDIGKAIPDTKAKLSTNWAYFIDSGGQPAYRELSPLFSRTAALNIIAIDLTKGLEEECKFEYRIGQHNLPINTELKYSNLDIIQSTISSEAILKPIELPYVTNMPDHPYYLIVGTRKKEAKEEDIKAMNETLKGCIFNRVTWKNIRESAIIFPVDTLLPAGQEREEASMKLGQEISNCGVSMTIKMPIRLFAFEISLQAEAEEKRRSFLTKNEVFAVGELLQLNNEEEVEKALQYLHNVTIILYYPQVLPNLVFVSPQPILDILSRLIAITYVDQAQLHLIANPPPLPDARINFSTSGCFKEKLLKIVGTSVFIHEQFQSSHMIALLKHLHIIAKVESRKEGDYFFPCALPSYNKSTSPSTKIKPLLVVWIKNDDNDDEILPVPQGMFPLIIVHLLNQKVYKVTFPPSGDSKKYYMCHDAMSLRVSRRYTLHIINRYTHIEINIGGDEKHCPEVWGLVDEAIKSSSNDIHVKQTHTRAFECPEGTEENCYCIVENDRSTYCTKCQSPYDIHNDESYQCWFRLQSGTKRKFTDEEGQSTKKPHTAELADTSAATSTVATSQATPHTVPQPEASSYPPGPVQGELNINHMDRILEVLNKAMFGPVKWQSLGLKLGLYITTLNVISRTGGDANNHLMQTIQEWLEKKDGVRGTTWQILIDAVKNTGDRAAAERMPAIITKKQQI